MTNENQHPTTLIEKTSSVFEFSPEPIRTPLYSNACLVNLSANDVFIDFGFADTYPVKLDKQRVDEHGVEILSVAPVARISVSLQVAAVLHRQLDDLFKALRQLQVEHGGESDTQK